MPTVVRPAASTPAAAFPPIASIVPPTVANAGLWYFNALEEALAMATDIRVGEPVQLRYDDDNLHLTVFSARFAGTREPLSLYAMATRQIDWMAEYLCLYRVLEWANRDNGKSFIAEHLDELATYDFGILLAQPLPHEPIDVFDAYRKLVTGEVRSLSSGAGGH